MIRYFAILMLSTLFHNDSLPHEPLFFAMGAECLAVVEEEEVFQISGADSSLTHSIYLLRDTQNQARLFYAPIITPVCIDGKCKPLHITLYWNLIGHYVGYALPPGIPLSKFDHEAFEPADYERLHHLLLDDKSVLKRKKLEDLFDPSAAIDQKVKYKGEEIDAVTGATKKEIKASLVAGALYSCYTLWHLAHGAVQDSIEAFTLRHSHHLIEEYLLYTKYTDYQYFALRKLDSIGLMRHVDRVVGLLPETAPLTRSYLLKKLPKTVFADSLQALRLYRQLPLLDLNAKTLLVKNLVYAHSSGLEACFAQLTSLSKNQIKVALQLLEQDPTLRTPRLTTQLQGHLEKSDFRYRYLVAAFLLKYPD